MDILHNSQLTEYRSPTGAVPTDTQITFSLHAPTATDVFLRLWYDGMEHLIPMGRSDGSALFRATAQMPSTPKLVWYYFIVYTNDAKFFYGNNAEHLGGLGKTYETEPPSYQITVYDSAYTTPKWLRDAVIYQIFVDRFYNGNPGSTVTPSRDDYAIHPYWSETVYYNTDSEGNLYNNDFFGGNLLGIIKKLDYLEDLGVTVLYLNPIFEAWSNHKYDTADYEKIDPMFGDEEIFKKLCAEAKKRGINIILDGVFNHTGSDSRYFNKTGHYPEIGAYQGKGSKYYDWFTFDQQYNCGYSAWWGVHSLPSINEMTPSYRDYIIRSKNSIIKRWLRCGAKGWRLDVADELPDEFIRELRQAVKGTDPDAALIGEVWEDASNKISYSEQREYLLGHELDSVMNYPFKNAIINFILGKIDAAKLSRIISSIYENYPPPTIFALMNLLGSHDVERMRTLFGEAPTDLPVEAQRIYRLPIEKKYIANRRIRLAAAWQMTFVGAPCIYYGDEVSVEGYRDPFNRGTFPWNYADLEMRDWYKAMIALRKSRPELSSGTYRPLLADGDIFCYIREITGGTTPLGSPAKDGATIVALNRSKTESHLLKITLGEKFPYTGLRNAITEEYLEITSNTLEIHLAPLESKIFIT